MQGFGVLFVMLVLLLLLAAPILAVIALLLASGVSRRLEQLRQEVRRLDTRFDALKQTFETQPATGSTADESQQRAGAPSAAALSEPPSAAPVPKIAQAAPVPPPPAAPTPPGPAPQPATPVRINLLRTPAQVPFRAAAPQPSRPAVKPPQAAPSIAPPQPPPGPVARPTAASSAPFLDWESFIGIKGAAWLGGIALVIAALLFAKWAYDNIVVTAPMRVALMILAGMAALIGGESSRRRGYVITANAVSAAGIAILYIAFFAAHIQYRLVPAITAFALMILVTIVACLLAIQHDAKFIALLGLFGGFATPILLSTGEDRTLSLFAYILLLDLGLITIANRKRWDVLVPLSLLGTLVVQFGWFRQFMRPEKTPIAAAVFLVFGMLFLVYPRARVERPTISSRIVAAIAATTPFVLGWLLAADHAYLTRWPLLLVFITALDLLLIAFVLRAGRLGFIVPLSLACTLIFEILFLRHQLGLMAPDRTHAATGVLLAFGLLFLLSPALTRRRTDPVARRTGGLGGLTPFMFLLVLAADAQYSGQWGWLFALVGALNVAIVWSVARGVGDRLLLPFGLAGTLLFEVLSFHSFMEPDRLGLALGALLVSGLFYLFLPGFVRGDRFKLVSLTSVFGASAPFYFALLLAADAQYAGEWRILFAFVCAMNVALVTAALVWRRSASLFGGALGTALFFAVWATRNLAPGNVWPACLAAIAVAFLLGIPLLVAELMGKDAAWDALRPLRRASIAAELGLLAFAVALVFHGLGDPAGPFAALLTALFVVLVLCTRQGRPFGLMSAGSIMLAILIQLWFFGSPHSPEQLAQRLLFPLALPAALSIVAVFRSRLATGGEDEAGVVTAASIAYLGLYGSLPARGVSIDPVIPFGALAALALLLIASVLRRGWTSLLPLLVFACALLATAWQGWTHRTSDAGIELSFHAAFYLLFVMLPFAALVLRGFDWRSRTGLWLALALAGPAYFFPFYFLIVWTYGRAWIGLVPLAQAVVSLLALCGVSLVFSATEESLARLRLRYLALFSALALGFVALAVPLQLDRQWITISWALEAVALMWLFGRLPHPGLKLFGAALFAAVGVRLLLNPAVLLYEERGAPIVNWLLYTYGVPAVCCLVGASLLRRAQQIARGRADKSWTWLSRSIVGIGLLLVFWLINLEIFDFFSRGRYVELDFERQYARDLTMSLAWGLYGIVLLVIGALRRGRSLRVAALSVVALSSAKVFLYDLAAVRGIYRVFSFLGLAVALIIVSFLYQRFVSRKDAAS